MPLPVLLDRVALRDLDGLPSDWRAQAVSDIEAYAANPSPVAAGVKKLRGFDPPLYRLRSGDFRVIFRLPGAAVHLYRVIDRKNLERALRRLR